MPDTGVLRVLTSHQRATGLRCQLKVEKSLGLEKGAISSYFEKLRRAHQSKSTFAARRKLRVAGVYVSKVFDSVKRVYSTVVITIF